MSTLYLADKKCFHCGTEDKFPYVDKHITIVGPKDLDGRPTHIQRSAVYTWIQRCSGCGYSTWDIAEGNSRDKKLIASLKYQLQLSNIDYPETANSYLAHLLLMENEKRFADAGWDAVFSSWICDDNGFNDSAIKSRIIAIDFFCKAKKTGQSFAPQPVEENIFLIDLYRRTQQFSSALQLCIAELRKDTMEDTLWNIISYQKELIEKSDCGCHNDIDAEENEELNF